MLLFAMVLIHWNLDITKGQGIGKSCSLWRGFFNISRFFFIYLPLHVLAQRKSIVISRTWLYRGSLYRGSTEVIIIIIIIITIISWLLRKRLRGRLVSGRHGGGSRFSRSRPFVSPFEAFICIFFCNLFACLSTFSTNERLLHST